MSINPLLANKILIILHIQNIVNTERDYISNFSAKKSIKLLKINFIANTNFGLDFKHVLPCT